MVMKKVLFTATVDSHILNFHIPFLKWFKNQGYEVHVASKGNSAIPFVDIKHNVPFNRSPYNKANIKAYREMKNLIKKYNYELIHCHTPMGSVLTRLAAINVSKKRTTVIYTAHGFHFFKGAPLINWLLYYPIEKWMSRSTDCLITINEEDYNLVEKNFKSSKIKLVNGVGINLDKFQPQTSEKKAFLRSEQKYNDSDFILFFAGELSFRKNQELLISVISILKEKIPNIKLLLAGEGDLSDKYKQMVNNLGLSDNIHLLGYRNDVKDLLLMSDIAVSSSRQEGLPVNIMEAMATGLPLIVTDCRGNRDLVKDFNNGFVIKLHDIEGFADKIYELYANGELRKRFSQNNLEIINNYSIELIERWEIFMNTI
ncbi:glycosyltransferase family 4 protein [Peribacillus simplex]|uniref:Glycosyltransferase family 1 protein n=1 Tax=Peribacillus simplex NBRC 15720 = DSM 1321 TaxID=1349754 RepID=A0A223ELH9_9BACI|nr:glycosyltransferase family 1 protein [Peribacillus simplex NBRC 15720 = DSM 1321]